MLRDQGSDRPHRENHGSGRVLQRGVSADHTGHNRVQFAASRELVPPGSLQLETLLKGVFDKVRFLDLIRNFIVFEDDGDKVVKKLAGYWIFTR